ncbi:MAG: hypothetical protein JW896_14525 [Deltaproteobacteria bacterium]|nr:hypothetical protein [Deltaproteobacteria bacterium]
MIEGLPASLFPYSHFSGTEIKKILSLFGPLRLFCPWFMEPPSLQSINVGGNTIDIQYPLKEMKPEEHFKTLLLEYSRWIRANQDKGYTEFLRANQEAGHSENTTWEIRGMIRNGKREKSPDYKTLRYHLILHLAQDMENQRREADRMLTSLKEKGILFKGIIDESDDVQNPVEDLPSFESDFFMPERHLRHIFEAWFALFGVYIREDDLLLTLNRHFMNYAEELWKKEGGETQVDGISSLQFRFPDFSHLPLEDLYEIKRTSSGNNTMRELRDLLLSFGDDPIHNLPRLEKMTTNLEKSYPHKKTENSLKITFKYLPPFPEAGYHEHDSLSICLENRILFLIEE